MFVHFFFRFILIFLIVNRSSATTASAENRSIIACRSVHACHSRLGLGTAKSMARFRKATALTWFLQIFSTLLSSLHVRSNQLATIRAAAAQAPLLLLPTHQSHLDYLMLSHILYNHDINVPHVAAGMRPIVMGLELRCSRQQSGCTVLRLYVAQGRSYFHAPHVWKRRTVQGMMQELPR